MKSPKDMLLEQHAEATPALDGIRDQVVTDLRRSTRRHTPGFWAQAWVQLILRPRRIWCSLATVWIVMLVVRASLTTGTEDQSARQAMPKQPILEQHHNVLRAELGLPQEQRAEKSDRVIHQSHNDKHSFT